MNTSGGGDEPRVPPDPSQDEERDSNGGVRKGYYAGLSKHRSMHQQPPPDPRRVVRPDQMRTDEYVEEVIKNGKLRDMTATYEVVEPLSEGNDGEVFYMLEKGLPYVLKIHKTGVIREYIEFQLALLLNIDNPDAKAHPGYAAVYYAAMPVGWATHMGKKGLVFRYVTPPRKPRRPNANDRDQVRDQMAFLHWLLYVHLDITDRNIMLADENKCFLMDFDSVCKIGRVPLGPLPKECTEALLSRRYPAHLDDDDHLWQHLQTTFFKDLPADEVKQAPVEVKQQQQAPARWSPEKKWKTVSVDPSGTIATKTDDQAFGYIQTTEAISKGVYTWKVNVVKKLADRILVIGVSAPGIQPTSDGTTDEDSSSYGMWSGGGVMAAGQWTIVDYTKLPASSIIQADLLKQRERFDKVFRAGDEVVVVLDCTAHTLTLQSPTLQHVIPIQQQHHQQQWVLNVNFHGGDFQVSLG